MTRKTHVQGVYVALEDFIEKASSNKTPPILHQHNVSTPAPLRNFTALPNDQLCILGSRRVPPVVSPHSNTKTAVSIYTSVGFGYLEASYYADAARKLKPDILVGLGDIPFGEKPGLRRTEKMSGRTEQHMKEILDDAAQDDEDRGVAFRSAIFAPILPIEKEQQSFYVNLLADEWRDAISGLAIYDVDNVIDLPEQLVGLPRLSMSALVTPHKLLREISLGMDIFTVPFIGAATDAGISLDFEFPGEHDAKGKRPLGIEMSDVEHAASLGPLSKDCSCFACSKHHRAYIQHLLSAKEMLAWVLLQIHNLSIMDRFFVAVRKSIAEDRLQSDIEIFRRAYEEEMPAGTGQGPRVRGYQYKSEGPGETKRNPPAFKMLQDRRDQNSEAPTPGSQTDASDLVEQGFAEPVVGKD